MANATAKIPLSASTQGQGIKIAQTVTAGTLVHTTGTNLAIIDEIWLYLMNTHTADVLVTIEFGGPTAPDQNIILTVPFRSGLFLAVDGRILTGSGAAALTVKVFASVANVIVAYGHVMRITP
jgi:hypothetical protein